MSKAETAFPRLDTAATEITEADRDAVIDALKQAFVRDALTSDELGKRVAVAHVAESLDQPDAV